MNALPTSRHGDALSTRHSSMKVSRLSFYKRTIVLISSQRCQDMFDNQSIELRLHQRGWPDHVDSAQPYKKPDAQTPRSALHTEAIVYEHLDACGPHVGEYIAMVGVRTAQCANHVRKETLVTAAHVHRLNAQSQGVDTDYLNASHSGTVHSTAFEIGHASLTPSSPRLSSKHISSAATSTAMELGNSAASGGGTGKNRAMNQAVDSAVTAHNVPWPRHVTFAQGCSTSFTASCLNPSINVLLILGLSAS